MPIRKRLVIGDKSIQPEDSYSYAINVIIKDEDEAPSNEEGFSVLFTLPEDFVPIGTIYIGNGETVVFLVLNPESEETPDSNSQIIRVDKYGNSSIILGDEEEHNTLAFSIEHQIGGEFTVNLKGETVIFWQDDYNVDRYLNINHPYTGDFNIKDLSIQMLLVQQPNIQLIEVVDGGGEILTGSYSFTISLLDIDFNETNFVAHTKEVIVNDELKTVDSWEYDGSPPGIQTGKSILLNISNLAGNVKYYRIGVIVNQGGVGSYYKTEIRQLPEDLNNGFNFIYRGNTSLLASTEQELTRQFATYGHCKDMAQVNNILLRGNITEDIDLEYQQLANMITATYGVEEFDMDNIEENYKSPLTCFYKLNLMRDEVYALGITWLIDNGTEQTYQLIGRAKLEGNELSGGDDILVNDTTDGNGVYIDETPIWQVENTASPELINADGSPVDVDASYELGYYEDPQEVYPNSTEFDSTSLGGEDLRSTPIRHFKMPDIFNCRHYRNNNSKNDSSAPFKHVGRILYLKLSNICLPTKHRDRIVGFKITKIKRESHNKSVLMQGALFNVSYAGLKDGTTGKIQVINSFPYSGTEYTSQTKLNADSYAPDPSNSIVILNKHTFYSPEDRFAYGTQVVPDYFQVEYVGYANNTPYTTTEPATYVDADLIVLDPSESSSLLMTGRLEDLYIKYAYGNNYDPDSNVYKRRLIDKVVRVPNNQLLADLGDVDLHNENSPSLMAISNDGNNMVPAWKLLDNTTGYRCSTTIFKDGSYHIINRIEEDFGLAIYVVNLKKKYFSQYGNSPSLEYIDSGYNFYLRDTDQEYSETYSLSGKDDYDNHGINGINDIEHKVFAGDTFISNFWFRRTVGGNKDYFYDPDNLTELGTDNIVSSMTMNWMAVESMVNVDMRHGGEDENSELIEKQYYPKMQLLNPDGVLDAPGYVDNHWAYNTDYSVPNDFRAYFIKPINATFTNDYTTRIAYSLKNNYESVVTNMRKFLINNYVDLPKNKGELNKLVILNNNVYGHCDETLFVIPTDEQKLTSSDGTTITIGQGLFLSQEPKEVMAITENTVTYAGIEEPQNGIPTPIAYVFIDVNNRDIFAYTNQLQSIGNDIRGFLNKHCYFKLKEFIEKNLNSTIEANNAVNPSGIGFSLGYDSANKRVIIHKKDYLPNDEDYNFVTLFDLTSSIIDDVTYYTVLPDSNTVLFYEGKFYSFTVVEEAELSDIVPYAQFSYYDGDTYTYYTLTLIVNFDYTGFFEEEVTPTNSFKDTSFTISYSLKYNSWISSHDYKPVLMYSANNELFTYQRDNNREAPIWQFNNGTYGFFNAIMATDYIYPTIIEFILNPSNVEQVFSTIRFLTRCFNDNNILQIETFTTIIVFNDYQCSGEITLTKDEVTRLATGEWNFNRFRDLVEDYSLPFFNEDNELITSNIDTNKNWKKRSLFKSNYLGIIFKYSNDNNNKLLIYQAEAISKLAIR